MKYKVLHIISQVVSALLYPLLIPTYGMLLFCADFTRDMPVDTGKFWLITCLGTFIFTGLLPFMMVVSRIHTGKAKDVYMNDAQERLWPYIYTIGGYGCWAYMLYTLFPMMRFLFWIAIGATLAIGLVAVINHWWKISAHLTGMGGLFGGVCAYCLVYGQWPIGLMSILLGVSLLLMYARLYLDAHTPLQVVCGYLLGTMATFIPVWFGYHV